MEVLTADLMDLLRAVLISVTKILFFADLMLANPYTSNLYNNIIHGSSIDCDMRNRTDQCSVVVPLKPDTDDLM